MDETTSAIRVSDQDRSNTLRQLCDGFGQGRLDQAEFEARTDRALAAVTHADLRLLTADLPIDQRSVARAERAELLLETRWWVAGAVVMNGVWLVQSLVAEEAMRYWPALPLAIWALILLGAVIAPGTRGTVAEKQGPAAISGTQRARRRGSIDGAGSPSAGAR